MPRNPTIAGHLSDLARQHECNILFASESGSRAWGLLSPDSDFDVRFIYAHPLKWYLSIDDHRDTIETVFPDDIDMAGWELRKSLRVFSTCSIPLNEQIQSPIVYGGVESFQDRLRNLIPHYFNKKRAMHYYMKTADQALEGMDGLSIGLNRFFYAARPLLACQWIESKSSMPPTEFKSLLEADFLPLPLTNEVIEIAQMKAEKVQREMIKLSKDLVYWLTDGAQRHRDAIALIPSNNVPSREPLNELFLDSISEI